VGQVTPVSFDSFYRDMRPSLVGGLTRIVGDRTVAEDVAHDALSVVLRTWPRVSACESPYAWTWRVALNLNAKRLRRRRVELRHLPRQLTAPATALVEATPDMQLWAAVAALPLRQRIVEVLRVLDDRSYAEIADVVGCSADYARQLHRRGVDRLRSLVPETTVDG
jgi:RNA polymerase sigma factor (sigma-70 family)